MLPRRPLRPPNWKEAHRLGVVQPLSREGAVGGVHVRVTSILADPLRTYVELHWKSPMLPARMFIDRAELQRIVHDPATLCFVCGPPSLVEEMPKLLAELGVERRRIRMDEW